MQKHLAMILGLTLSVASVAHTDSSPKQSGTPLPPPLLGQIDGILSACTKIDPRDEDKFEKLHRSLTAGTSHRDQEAMEKNADYRASFNLMKSIFSSMAADDALRLCKDAVK
jgi:hypothetical protein